MEYLFTGMAAFIGGGMGAAVVVLLSRPQGAPGQAPALSPIENVVRTARARVEAEARQNAVKEEKRVRNWLYGSKNQEETGEA